MAKESEKIQVARFINRPTVADIALSPQQHMSHYSNLSDFHKSATEYANVCHRALGDIWKARDGLPYLERQLEEAKNAIVLARLGEPVTFNVGYIAGLKRIAELMEQIFAKQSAIALATKQFQEANDSLHKMWDLISTWYVAETARAQDS